MSATKSETGWTDTLPKVDGWYWTRKPNLLRVDVLHVVRSQVAFGAMWLNPVKDPTFFDGRVWLGPITPADFEQLAALREAAANLVHGVDMALATPGAIREPSRSDLSSLAHIVRVTLRNALGLQGEDGK